MGTLEDFVNNYYISPIINQTGKYNPVNTVTYAVIFFVVIYYIYEKVLKSRVKINSKFELCVVSVTFLASGLHVLKDMGILPAVIFDTPPIYVLMASFFLLSLWVSLLIQKSAKIEYWKTVSSVCLIPAVVIIIFIFSKSQNILGLTYIIEFFLLSSFITYLVHLKFPTVITKENFKIMTAHMLDASATFVSLSFFGYTEQHVLPTFITDMFGPVAMFPLKFFVIGTVLYLFDKEVKDKNFRFFLKMAVLIFGLGPGLRDTLRLMVPT